MIGHDGSYMPHLANNIIACAAVFYCSYTNQYADVTWVEKSSKASANNYHAKILGACSTQLIIKAGITRHIVLGHGPLSVGCNNIEVVQHDNSPQHPMLEKQPQSDVLQYFKGLMALSRIGGRMQHVYGHADEYLPEAEMSPTQQVNCRADKLATAALMAALEANKFISSIFPLEKVRIEITGERVTGSPKNAITELWGEQVTQVLYDRRGVVSKENFPFVYWEGMERVLKSFPEMFRVWVIKYVSHFHGTNQQLSGIDILVLNVSLSCKCHDESTSHITWCRDPGCAHTLKDLVGQLIQWLYDQQTDGKVVHLFKRCLLAGGTHTLTSLLKPNSRLGVEVGYHDRLGWDCFLES